MHRCGSPQRVLLMRDTSERIAAITRSTSMSVSPKSDARATAADFRCLTVSQLPPLPPQVCSTPVTYLAELADLRAEASHAGSTQGLHYLAPKASINASPHNHQGQGEDVKKGIAATLKHKCKKMVTKAAGSRYGSLYGSVTYEPFTAFNIMSKGMTISCLEEVEMFARIRIPAPGRGTDAKPGFAGSHTSDARAAYIFPAFDDAVNSRYEYKRTLAIELARHCYFCFQDRFYLVPEIAVLIRATQIAREMRHMNPFTILARDRDCARNHG